MKRVLIFSLAYYPSHVSGAESAIRDITDRIDEDDLEFHLITLHFDRSIARNEKIGHVHVHRVGFGPAYLSKVLFVPLAALRARTLHRQQPFDALWAMMTYMLFPTVLARACGVQVPYVLSLQDGDTYERVFERWFIRPLIPLLRYGFRHARVVQVISTYLATWPEKLGYKGPVELIYDGANPDSLHPTYTPDEVARVRASLALHKDDVLLMNTARLAYQKGADIAIRALALLPPRVRLVLVGEGPERDKLEELARELGLTDRVTFTGFIDRAEVTKYRLAADIFVGPSRSEGLGHAFLSAMACRVPVVATQVGGIADFLFDAKRNPDKPATGWAVDVDAPEQVAAAVEDILAHPETVKEVTDRARRMVEEKFDWDIIVRDMREKVFTRLVQKNI